MDGDLRESETGQTDKNPVSVELFKQEEPAAQDEITPEDKTGGMPKIIGRSAVVNHLFATIDKVADNNSTLLILGESGTGKELVAQAVHYKSNRKNRPLVVVNCGAIPAELLESELFGHEKGSFTGAIRTRVGRFEMADRGTIFLDEIGEMSPQLQVKILRILQEQKFERVGGNRTVEVDVRVIAATNRDLEKAIIEGNFREDLYYRLNVIPIEIPPLRERAEDIPLLVDEFLNYYARKNGRKIEGLSGETMQMLLGYAWPGNIRELKHLIERMVILKGEGIITPEDLPPKYRKAPETDSQLQLDMMLVGGLSGEEQETAEDTQGPLHAPPGSVAQAITIPPDGINLKAEVEKFETALILQALEMCSGVKNKAAKLLGLNRTTLVEKMKKRNLI